MQAYKFFIAFTLCIVTSHVALKAQIESFTHCDTLIAIDSTQAAKQSRIELKNLAAPVALIATGSILALDYRHGVNKTVNGWFEENSSQLKIDRYMHVLPSAAYLALSVTHIKAKHALHERLAAFATAHMLMAAMGYGLKAVVKEERPGNSGHHSFPSGHTTISFTGAELLRQEYGNTLGWAGYAVASAEAFLRVYNNKHWLGDVLAGAGIGILSARSAYWLLPWEQRLFGRTKKSGNATQLTAIPHYDAITRSVGMALVAHF